MINRVLIRIKVIQLLYSYLLTDNHFMLESQPSAPTKEKRFAYSLYLDLLVLMVKIARNIEKRGGTQPLADTRFIKKILADDIMRGRENKYRVEDFPFAPVVEPLSEAIKESALYKNLGKDSDKMSGSDDQIWERILNLIIYPDTRLNRLMEQRENYTLGGVERMKNMMAGTFKNFYASRDNIDDALLTLRKSMDKARELYFRLLTLPVELTRLRVDQLEENRQKYVPTAEDLNPNLRFVENRLVQAIEENEEVIEYCDRNKISWIGEHRQFLESLLDKIMQSDIYLDYMDFPATDMATDAEFWRNVYKHIIFHDEDFLELLESESVFWNDDIDIIGTFVLKTIKRFEENRPGIEPVLQMFKDEEDKEFGPRLFTDVLRNKDVYRREIDDALHTEKWDSDRLAFMDVVITMTALSEIMNFPKIPLVVSLNEYIEIAKSYSTNKSGYFVNGLLSCIIDNLKGQGKLLK